MLASRSRSSRWLLCPSGSRQASGSLGVEGSRSFCLSLICQMLGRSCSGQRAKPGAVKVRSFSSCPAECFLGQHSCCTTGQEGQAFSAQI